MSKTPATLQPNERIEAEPVRVSVSEAARLFGVSARTVRRAITSAEKELGMESQAP